MSAPIPIPNLTNTSAASLASRQDVVFSAGKGDLRATNQGISIGNPDTAKFAVVGVAFVAAVAVAMVLK